MRLFLFILAWFLPIWWIVCIIGVAVKNADVKNKIYGRQYVVPTSITYSAIIAVAYIIYWFLS